MMENITMFVVMDEFNELKTPCEAIVLKRCDVATVNMSANGMTANWQDDRWDSNEDTGQK